MPTYAYKAIKILKRRPDGKIVTGAEVNGTISAANTTEASCRILEQGLNPVKLERVADVQAGDPMLAGKVSICNLTPKTFVVNSAGIRIPPGGTDAKPVIRDASIMNDPDIMELVASGQITILPIQPQVLVQAQDPVQAPVPSAVPQAPAVQEPQQSRRSRRDERRRRRRRQNHDVSAPAKSAQFHTIDPDKVATTFEDPDDPVNQMGGSVVVMTDKGPMKGKMGPGINNAPGPKFVGDPTPDSPSPLVGGDDEEEVPTAFVKIT